MKPVNNVAKTNEQYISDFQDGKICDENLYQTPYPNLFILVETKEEEYSYRDEDGDLVYSKRTIIVRKAFIKYEDEKYSFLIDNWFDDIDNFSLGLYAKVQLGGFYNLVNPLGEYLFSEWFAKIDLYGNNLFCCYVPSSVTKSNLYEFRPVPCVNFPFL